MFFIFVGYKTACIGLCFAGFGIYQSFTVDIDQSFLRLPVDICTVLVVKLPFER